VERPATEGRALQGWVEAEELQTFLGFLFFIPAEAAGEEPAMTPAEQAEPAAEATVEIDSEVAVRAQTALVAEEGVGVLALVAQQLTVATVAAAGLLLLTGWRKHERFCNV
jgi:hypothetical protein